MGCQNLRCHDFKGHLESLGFIVSKSKKGNHYSYSHASLAGFFGGGFNGGHGKNEPIKPCYVRDFVTILKLHEAAFNPRAK